MFVLLLLCTVQMFGQIVICCFDDIVLKNFNVDKVPLN